MTLTAKQRKAIALLYDNNKKNSEIAAEVDVAPETLSRWKKQPEFKQAVADYALEFIGDKVPLLIKNMLVLASSSTKSSQVRFQATQDLLNRAGITSPDKLEIDASFKQVTFIDDVPKGGGVDDD